MTINFSVPSITAEEIREVTSVLKSGWITTGMKNKELCEKINAYIGSKYCILMNSCTAALHIALIAAGIKPGDEVITSPLTFVSTVNTITYLGAKPVFVDIKPNDFIIDEDKIEEKITKKTKAILPVHYAGFSANLDKLRKICKKYKLELIEDAAHAFGSKYIGNDSEFIGQNSRFCAFSFYPTKNITTIEGGALVTNDEEIYKRSASLALHGISRDAWKRYTKGGSWRYDVTDIGWKYNLTDIAAVLGLVQLKRIKEMQTKREKIYQLYKKELAGVESLEILEGNSYTNPFRHIFVVKITSKKCSRDRFVELMKEKDIICSVHFIPVYQFTAYKKLLKPNPKNYPQTEKAFEECVSLPFGAAMSTKEVQTVIETIKKILK